MAGMNRAARAGVIALTLLIFGGGVCLVSLRLRNRIRAEVLEREAAILSAVARHEASGNGRTLLDLVLRVVDMDGVIGIRIFEPDGRFVRALPDNLIAGPLAPRLVAEPSTDVRFSPRVRLCTVYADLFGETSDETLPMLNVSVPIHDPHATGLIGFAEFLVDGRTTAEAFGRLDRDLSRQALTAILGGGAVIAAILLLSFRQLEAKNRELAAANRALRLHAKTAAIGAVASHLFHRLKNALAGLQMAICEDDGTTSDAVANARRMDHMVQEVIDVLREEDYGIAYDLTAAEILELVCTRTRSAASARGVRVAADRMADRSFANRDANLLLLAIENLVCNAVEASPSGGAVECAFREDGDGGRFVVTDHGDGIPEERRLRLFEPGDSAKAGGSGIGLSISYQLCRQIGVDLRLAHTGPAGTTFEIRVPGVSRS